MNRSPLPLCVALALVGGCSRARTPEPNREVAACAIGENLAGDWVRVDGTHAELRHRLRLMPLGDRIEATLVEGDARLSLDGVRMGAGLQLTERAAVGQTALRRFYAQVRPRSCTLRIVEVRLRPGDGREEQLPGGYVDLLPYPAGAELSWAICTETARLNGAVEDQTVAVNAPLSIAATSEATIDGSSRCTYTFDVYLDDFALPEHRGEPAQLRRGLRLWEATLRIPYAGQHFVEIHRHRRCPDQEPTLLGVACTRAVTR